MPRITVQDGDQTKQLDVPADKRLLLALIDDAKTDQLHACGGQARCTTCRVQFLAGEPERITQAEKDLLQARGLTMMPGVRLSCQILCEHDMEVKIISRLAGSGRVDAGKRPDEQILPSPLWTT